MAAYYKGSFYQEATIKDLEGAVLSSITGMEQGGDGDEVRFNGADGKVWLMYHEQYCCETVRLEDVNGNVEDLIGVPIVSAVEVESGDTPPQGDPEYVYSYTWTFYRVSTIKGTVVLRWYGESNGYYSERVDICRLDKKKEW